MGYKEQSGGVRAVSVLIVAGLVVGAWFWIAGFGGSGDDRSAVEKFGIDTTRQSERRDLLADLEARGIIRGLVYNTADDRVDLLVGSEFAGLTPAGRGKFAGVAFAFFACDRPACRGVRIKSLATDIQVGTWDPYGGLNWD